MENSKIAWTTHTFNPWIGCQKVSPACDNCYAEALVKRWGKDFSERRRTSEANWKTPLAWNKRAAKTGEVTRVFCGSLCDVFDPKVPVEWVQDLARLMVATPHLRWLMLTKRPKQVFNDLTFPNVHYGITAENQEWLQKRMAKGWGVHLFVSVEPMLGEVNIKNHVDRIDWVIIGCEKINGRPGRSSRWEWIGSLISQCEAYNIPVFVKQMEINGQVTDDISKFPEWARLRQFPESHKRS